MKRRPTPSSSALSSPSKASSSKWRLFPALFAPLCLLLLFMFLRKRFDNGSSILNLSGGGGEEEIRIEEILSAATSTSKIRIKEVSTAVAPATRTAAQQAKTTPTTTDNSSSITTTTTSTGTQESSPSNNKTIITLTQDDPLMNHGRSTLHMGEVSPIVLHKHKLLFFYIPKVACEEFKKLFRRMEGHSDWATPFNADQRFFPDQAATTVPHDPAVNGLTYLCQLPLHKANAIMNDPTWTKAIFVRDPLSRFLSAYLDKIVRHPNVPERREWSFERFIDKVEGGLGNIHWQQQSQVYELRKWLPVMDFVGSFDNLAEDTEKLLRKVGAWEDFGASGWGEDGSESMFRGRKNEVHSAGTEDKIAKYYEKASTRERVKKLMAGDVKYIGTKIE